MHHEKNFLTDADLEKAPFLGGWAKPREQQVKIVVVGDSGCGKTNLIFSYAFGRRPEKYLARVFENFTGRVAVDGQEVSMTVVDTVGQAEYDRLRALSYPGAHVFALCYRVGDPQSFANVTAKWFCEYRHYCPSAQHVLVACAVDRRHSPELIEKLRSTGDKPVSTEEGAAFAQRSGAFAFVETSAETNEGVREVFEQCVRAAMQGVQRDRARRNGACALL